MTVAALEDQNQIRIRELFISLCMFSGLLRRSLPPLGMHGGIALLFFVVFFIAASTEASAQLRSVAHYEEIAEKAYAETKSRWDGLASSPDGDRKYHLQYPMMGYLDIYEATGKEKYLARVLNWAETAVSKASIKDKDGYLHWAGPASDFGVSGISYYLHEAQGYTEIARVARLILVDGSSTVKSKYGSRAQKLADHTRKHFVQRYWPNSIFSWMNQTCNPPAHEPWRAFHDKQLIAARILLDISLIYNNAIYKKMGVDTIQCLRSKMEEWRGALVWAREFIPADFGTGDVSHANRVARVLTDYYRQGLVISRSDINKLAVLLTDVIWNGSPSNPLFTNYVDGTNTAFRNRGPYEVGSIYHGWGNLASYDCDAYRAADATLQFIYTGKTNASTKHLIYGDKLIGLAGPLALAASSGTCGEPAGSTGGGTSGPGPCHLLTSAQSIPQGFGAAYNLFSTAKEILVSATCGSTSNATINVGNGQNTIYVYRYGYEWVNGVWKQITIDGEKLAANDWYLGSAQADLFRSEAQLGEVNSVVVYTCLWQNSRWKCGCRDTACTQNYWQLQVFRK